MPKDQFRSKTHVPFRNKIRFYDEELLAPRPNLQLEDHPLSSVRHCFSIFPQLPCKLDTDPQSSPWGRAVPYWQGPAHPCHYMCLTCTRWCSWLRHCATSRKVAGSIPDGVIGIFHWHNPFDRTVALGPTQPLADMTTRIKLSGFQVCRYVGLIPLPPSFEDCLETWEPEPPGNLRGCSGL